MNRFLRYVLVYFLTGVVTGIVMPLVLLLALSVGVFYIGAIFSELFKMFRFIVGIDTLEDIDYNNND